MNQARSIILSDRHRAIVAGILASAGNRIGPVKVFGSRAKGRARPAADLDLVVFPPAPPEELSRLALAFEESMLPITVDLIAWDAIDLPDLRREIERHALPWAAPSEQKEHLP